MMPRLRDEDRLALDLLLDRAVAGAGKNGSDSGHTRFTPVNGSAPEQIGRVEAVLKVLEMMPAEDPPADLTARTMRRVEAESARQDPSALRPPAAVSQDLHVPHA
jgi:hypothetical protein